MIPGTTMAPESESVGVGSVRSRRVASKKQRTGAVRPATRRLPKEAAFNVTLLLGCLVWLLPLLICLVTALQPQFDVLAGLSVIPHHVTLSNFTQAWQEGGLGTYYKNSLIMVAVKVPLGVLLAALAAFPLARYRFRGRKPVLVLFLLGLGVTPLVVLFPLTILSKDIGTGGSLWSVLFPYLAFGLPFEILVLRGGFLGVPGELLEAARVDGANELWIWGKIVMPLVRPVLGSLLLLDAISTWNEFLIAFILINQQSGRTLQIGLLNFQGTFSTNVSLISAGTVIALIPMICVFVALRRQLVRGIGGGALKY
jgi:raffinose/stachyose/melibiose transport system permease protein